MASKVCTLNYTLTDSEPCRSPLQDALENDGWKKTGHAQQTRWTGNFDEAKFIKTKDGEKYWDEQKIKSNFRSYFSKIEDGQDVDAKFVLTVGGSKDYIIHVYGKMPDLSISCRAD